MNLKNNISCLALFTLILSMSNCKTASVPDTKLNDFSFLNGDWIKRCDSIITGEYKGEVECVMLEEDAVPYTININGNQGLLVRELPRTKDTIFIAFEYNQKGRLLLKNRSKDQQWKQGVHQADSVTLKLYAKDSIAISFFKRRRKPL